VDYTARRDAGNPPEQRYAYQSPMTSCTLPGPQKRPRAPGPPDLVQFSVNQHAARAADQPAPGRADPAEVLRHYKAQNTVEQRYNKVKSRLTVAPMFLHTNAGSQP
jgi:hypothetical protein